MMFFVLLALSASLGVVLIATPYTTVGGALVMVFLVILGSVFLLPKLIPARDRKFLTALVIVGLVAKLTGSIARLSIGELVYGLADARRYDSAGEAISAALRAGDFATATATLTSDLAPWSS